MSECVAMLARHHSARSAATIPRSAPRLLDPRGVPRLVIVDGRGNVWEGSSRIEVVEQRFGKWFERGTPRGWVLNNHDGKASREVKSVELESTVAGRNIKTAAMDKIRRGSHC